MARAQTAEMSVWKEAIAPARGTALLVFARSPRADARRKLRAAGPAAAAGVTGALLAHTLGVAEAAGRTTVLAADADAARWAPAGMATLPQRGAGFGERFRNAVADAFAAGFDRVIAVGADVPGLTSGVLRDAVARLETGDDRHVVIGPSHDGGYYLIGFNRFDERAFAGIPWHTRAVLACTRRALAGSRLSILTCLTDADDVASLRRALDEVPGTSHGLRAVLRRLLAPLPSSGVRPSDPPAVRWRAAALPALRRGPPPALAA